MRDAEQGATAAPTELGGAKCTACLQGIVPGANYCVACGTQVFGGQLDPLAPQQRDEDGTPPPEKPGE